MGEAGCKQESLEPTEPAIPVATSEESSSSTDDEKEKKEKKLKKKNKKKKQKEKQKLKKKEKGGLTEALKEEERNQAEAERMLATDERKRPYNSMYEAKKPTEDEMEAYFLKRRREEDPMNQFL